MNTPSRENLENRFSALKTVLQEAETALKSGKIIYFQGLESEANTLCAMAEKSSPEIAKHLREPMAEIISTLDALAIKLEDFKKQKQTEKRG